MNRLIASPQSHVANPRCVVASGLHLRIASCCGVAAANAFRTRPDGTWVDPPSFTPLPPSKLTMEHRQLIAIKHTVQATNICEMLLEPAGCHRLMLTGYSAQRNREQSPLLRLPGELMDRIYKLTLSGYILWPETARENDSGQVFTYCAPASADFLSNCRTSRRLSSRRHVPFWKKMRRCSLFTTRTRRSERWFSNAHNESEALY